jgi:hypothetical protein
MMNLKWPVTCVTGERATGALPLPTSASPTQDACEKYRQASNTAKSLTIRRGSARGIRLVEEKSVA